MPIHASRALVIGPSGVVVQVRKSARLKPGWRLATDADLAACSASAAKPAEQPTAAPAPTEKPKKPADKPAV